MYAFLHGEVLELLQKESVEAIAGVRSGASKAPAAQTRDVQIPDEMCAAHAKLMHAHARFKVKCNTCACRLRGFRFCG